VARTAKNIGCVRSPGLRVLHHTGFGRAARAEPLKSRTLLDSFLASSYGPWLTHFSLLALTTSLFVLIFWLPLWASLLPCALLHHRIGILLHEYVHGIPFRRHKHNLLALAAYDGLMLSFGMLEVFRGIHLAHHRWLNTDNDPVCENSFEPRGKTRRLLWFLEGTHYARYTYESFKHKHRHVKPSRIVIAAALSSAWIAFWILTGSAHVVGVLFALNLYTSMVPTSLRGALEHRSYLDDPNFANEYRAWLPLFNLNKHVHHHLDSRCPWYFLEFCTPKPLGAICYWTHWYHVFIRRDYVFMKPPNKFDQVRAKGEYS
jgi:fatty acid desaturase